MTIEDPDEKKKVHPRARLRGCGRRACADARGGKRGARRGPLLVVSGSQNWKTQAKLKFSKFLAGSFSAVSKRKFARKYAFDSIFQALQDLHSFVPLRSQNFRKKQIDLKNQQIL